MSALIRIFLVRSLLAWGAISLIGVLAIIGFVAFKHVTYADQPNGAATFKDVRFVLNWCALGDKRFISVMHSHVTARSLGGDHLDAYAIKISHVSPSELPSTKRGGWHRGDQLPMVIDDAVGFAETARNSSDIPWFPPAADIRNQTYYVYLWSIKYYGTDPSAVDLILVRPADNMVYYIGLST